MENRRGKIFLPSENETGKKSISVWKKDHSSSFASFLSFLFFSSFFFCFNQLHPGGVLMFYGTKELSRIHRWPRGRYMRASSIDRQNVLACFGEQYLTFIYSTVSNLLSLHSVFQPLLSLCLVVGVETFWKNTVRQNGHNILPPGRICYWYNKMKSCS